LKSLDNGREPLKVGPLIFSIMAKLASDIANKIVQEIDALKLEIMNEGF